MKKILQTIFITAAFLSFINNSSGQGNMGVSQLKFPGSSAESFLKHTDPSGSQFHRVTPSALTNTPKIKAPGSGFGIRFGLGTDITLGMGFGLGALYILVPSRYSSTSWDMGADIYYANVSESETDSEGTNFDDNTKVFVFAVRTNGVFNYHPNKPGGIYFLAGAGFVLANINWEETITYHEPYLPHTEKWSDDGTSFGNILNLGAGMTFGSGIEVRLETPLLIFYSVPGRGDRNASSVAPTFTLSLLFHLR